MAIMQQLEIGQIATIKGAEFSNCKKYRYSLWRIWNESNPLIAFIGLNPSTANENYDDPTIKRVCKIARNNGYGGIYMINLFGFITPNPCDLKKCDNPIGDNDNMIQKVLANTSDVVFAWGNFKEALERSKIFIEMLPNAKAIEINKNGSPKHPLYCKATTRLIDFRLKSKQV